jgi:hypothetical protein
MQKLSELEFAQICAGIWDDRDAIVKHNPVGTRHETLLWMLMSCLISYLSLSEIETPCFTGRPDEKTYRDAILYIVEKRRAAAFDAEKYINKLLTE